MKFNVERMLVSMFAILIVYYLSAGALFTFGVPEYDVGVWSVAIAFVAAIVIQGIEKND